jgi:hypothetical protein
MLPPPDFQEIKEALNFRFSHDKIQSEALHMLSTEESEVRGNFVEGSLSREKNLRDRRPGNRMRIA